MKTIIKTLCTVSIAVLLAGCASSKGGSSAAIYHCNLTGQDYTQCCCETKEGKLYCTKANKYIDRCCCTIEPAGKK